MNPCRRLHWRSLPFLVCLAAPAFGQADTRVSVRQWARALQPGEVVRVTLRVDEPIERVEAAGLGRTIAFYPLEDGLTWEALVGVDLEIAPGPHTIDIRAISAMTPPLVVAHDLTIAAKRFSTRRLTVAGRYVAPPPEVRERIEREAERLAEIFASAREARLWRQPFITPVPGRATSSFGRRSVVNGEEGNPHRGADFRAAFGTPVVAPNAGEIALAEDLYYSGRTVIVDHGLGLFSLLAHLSAINVKQGDRVLRGATVGRSGATGRVTGPHLHWAVRVADASVDPLSLLVATRPGP